MCYFFLFLEKKKNLNNLNITENDFSICTEFIIKAHKKFNCTEVLSKERKRLYGVSKVNKFFDGLSILNNIIKLYFK